MLPGKQRVIDPGGFGPLLGADVELAGNHPPSPPPSQTYLALLFTAHHTTNLYFLSPTGLSCPHSLFLPDKLIRWKAPQRPGAGEHYHLEARQKS